MPMRLEGGKDLSRQLLQLDDKVARTYMSHALRAGAEEVAANVHFSAPVRTGQLSASIAISVRGGKQADVSCEWYGRFVNDGTSGRKKSGGRKTKKERAGMDAGSLTGAIKATHFMTEALQDSSEQATNIIGQTLRADIEGSFRRG